ncbi:hypothetical protein DXG01_010473, partial [Tephrocybe rancida]
LELNCAAPLHGWKTAFVSPPPSIAFEACMTIPISVFYAAIKEYEEDSRTDKDGEMEP